MKKLEIPVVIILLAIAFGVRVFPLMHLVMGQNINFYSVDDYLYLHNMDNILSGTVPQVDMLRNFPDGVATGSRLPYAYFLSFFPQLLNSVNPDSVIVWIPPILLVISLIAIYIISRTTFGTGPALIGLAILSVIPGEFLSRTAFGAIDQHCLEICLSSLLLLFILLTFKSGNKVARIAFSALSGITLGIFMITWEGTLLFVMIIVLAMAVCWIVRKGNSSYWEFLICFTIAAIITRDMTIALIIAGIIFLYITCNLAWQHKLWIGTSGIILATAIAWLIFPLYVNGMFANFRNIFIWHIESATAEEAPLLIQNAQFELSSVWTLFAGSFYLFIASIGCLFFITKKSKDQGYILIMVWSIILLFATLSMRRFTYYLSIPIAITVGYFFWIASKALVCDTVRTATKLIIKRISWGTTLLMIAAISMLIFVPSIQTTMSMSNAVIGGAISPGWREALTWVSTQTKDTKDYGILSWWDYGYWIIRESNRAVYCDPGGGNRRYAGWVLSSSNIQEIKDSMKSMKVKYIIIDYLMATSKDYSIVQHAAEKAADYQELSRMYYDRRKGIFNQALLYYPSYYNQLMIRLYNFNTSPVVANGCPVFKYEDHNGYLEITEIKDMPDYNAAIQYIGQQPRDTYSKYVIAGTNPFSPPINIEQLDGFKMVFASKSVIQANEKLVVPEVKIFEVMQ